MHIFGKGAGATGGDGGERGQDKKQISDDDRFFGTRVKQYASARMAVGIKICVTMLVDIKLCVYCNS